jgi:glycosyltransferase involved in cell wall biosynthesis
MKSILIYSGHCEIVGGDAKYIFELINTIPKSLYKLKIITDVNTLFKDRADQWLIRKDVSIEYLNTSPTIFKLALHDRIFNRIEEKLRRINFFNWLFTGKGRFNMYYLFRKLWELITLFRFRQDMHNIILFWSYFKKHSSSYDIFHYNNGGYPGKRAGLIALTIAKIFNLKTLMTVHNFPLQKRKFSPMEMLFDYFVRKNCDMILTASKCIEDKLKKDRGFLKIMTIYVGVDSEYKLMTYEEILSYKKKLGISNNEKVLLLCANISEERKGHRVLLRSLKKILPLFPKIKLIFVGDGVLKDSISLEAVKLGLNNNVLFLGHRQDIDSLNCISDIAIIPSIGFEATPYTIKEAMKYSKPVITTRAGGCAEAVVDNETGILVEQGDDITLAEAILKLLSDSDLSCKMGSEGRKLFLKRFRIEETTREHLDVFDKLIAPKIDL